MLCDSLYIKYCQIFKKLHECYDQVRGPPTAYPTVQRLQRLKPGLRPPRRWSIRRNGSA